MNESLLARVRIWTILVAVLATLISWWTVSGLFAWGVLATALWAVAGFYVLEKLLRAVVVPPGAPRNGFAVILWFSAKLAIYAAAVWVLFSRPFPALSHALGFTLMMVLLVGFGAGARARDIKSPQAQQTQGVPGPGGAAGGRSSGEPHEREEDA